MKSTDFNPADWCDVCIQMAHESGAWYPGDDRPPSKHPIAYAKIRQSMCDCYKKALDRNNESSPL